MLTECQAKNYIRINVIILLLFLGNPIVIHSQSDADYKVKFHNWFDQTIGIENAGLYNGAVYSEKYRMHDEKQKFLFSTSFLLGTIHYDGQTYFDVEMKYDVFEDEVVIKLSNELLLDNSKINRFTINGHLFEKIDYTAEDGDHRSDFFEKLIETPFFKFIKRHKKDKREKMGKTQVYYEFVDRNEYFLLYQDTFHIIRSRTDIVKVFPNLADEIRKRFKKSRRKIGEEEYFSTLLNEVYLMMSLENSKKIE